jgi:pimeloyl-ACP methyl ester carboxylesterase
MASIVLVHGAYNELWGPNELAARWIPALQDGLWHVGRSIGPNEISVCFYGDLFRRDPEVVGAEQWAATRAGVEDTLTETVGEDALEQLAQLAGRQTYERTVDMFATMAADPSLRDRVRRRLLDLLDDTDVLVAHSLGTVVAHQVLVAHPEVAVGTLVTLGSPLGAPPFLTDGAWPGSAERWVNVVSVTDPVPEPGRVPDRFGNRVEERLVDNGHRGHHPEPYLNSRAVGEVVAAALATGSA